MSQSLQVFQTNSQSRWMRFKWTFRIVAFIFILMIAVLGVSVWKSYNPGMPALKEQNEAYKKILNPGEDFVLQNKINKEYAGFRKFIDKKSTTPSATAKPDTSLAAGIRSAFYVAWDAQSYFSLRNNISKLNMILSEWIFIDPHTDNAYTKIDNRALKIIQQSNVKVVPMLSNFYHDDTLENSGYFDGKSIHRIINDPQKRARLINTVLSVIQQNHFAGINVDFEELVETSDEQLINFQKELYNAFHKNGLIVTQDISPFNSDYNYKELADYNDYIFLMAYDEHNNESVAGPVSSQKWIEAALDEAAKDIPSKKIVLGMAAYGYDWPQNDIANDVTYQEALTTAAESEGKVDFDNNTYNLHYDYYDDNNIKHDVYFTDAATNFNTMRFAANYGVAGVALWRMGSEDSRIWQFYDKDVNTISPSYFLSPAFTEVNASNDVDYIGEGEILEVKSNPQKGKIIPEIDTSEMLISEEHYESLPSMFVVKKYGKADKKIVLTFDDGPDPDYTPRILKILKKENVPASFFMVGINAENNIPLVKTIYKDGYELGNHSFTHPNMAEVSNTRAKLERKLTRLLIESVTGHSTLLFRAPYNADSEPETMEELKPVADSRTENYLTVGENIDPEDWEPGVTADSIFSRVVQQQHNGNIILLHDAGGNREATIQALPRIIQFFKEKGYTFTTVADLIGKSKADVMPAVTGTNSSLISLNYFIAEAGYYGSHILSALFLVFIFLGLSKIILMAVLAFREKRNENRQTKSGVDFNKGVSIIIPAYNEEVNAVATLKNLLQTTYPLVEFIFVDDGSKDKTYEVVSTAFKDNPKVKVVSKPNGGKASALNFGIKLSNYDYVVCIDADTKLLPDAIGKLMQHFTNENTGAVAGNVKVGNEKNMLTLWQSIEYTTAQNFDRRAMAAVNAITVVPGAIGAFRKEAIEKAGGFTTDTLAEDCDLTIRILKCDYTVENENDAVALTESPESLRMFIKQRFRWSFGVMQTFWKHRDVLFNTKYKWLGWMAFPNMLLFQFIIPLFAPLADLLMIIGLLTGNAEKILTYYFLFLIVEAGVALVAFTFANEKWWKLVLIFPQRIIYRWLMIWVLLKAYIRAIKGEMQHWGILKRTGSVNMPAASSNLQTAS